MASKIWEFCELDAETQAFVDSIDGCTQAQDDFSYELSTVADPSPLEEAESVFALEKSLDFAEQSCETAVVTLDSILRGVHEIGLDFEDVTSRTNSLMRNCEDLLEQQHSLQQAVEILKKTLEPFNDIEVVANLLGIPFDIHGSGMGLDKVGRANVDLGEPGTALDPRSPEFHDILQRIAKSTHFLSTHKHIRDSQLYLRWLERLEHRATSLVARSMREILEKASKTCHEIQQQKLYSRTSGGRQTGAEVPPADRLSDDQPIESAPIYQKFRGLTFRIRELAMLLQRSSDRGNDSNSPRLVPQLNRSRPRKGFDGAGTLPQAEDRRNTAMKEVIENYVMLRNELVVPFVKDAWQAVVSSTTAARMDPAGGRGAAGISTSTPPSAGSQSSGISLAQISLGTGIRQAYSTLLRVTQLEQQLFEAFFNVEVPGNASQPTSLASLSVDSANTRAPSVMIGTPREVRSSIDGGFIELHGDVLAIIETISNVTRDFIRPMIIRESSVDELCKVVSTLGEDVRSQMLAMPVPRMLLRVLLKGLDSTVSDAKERLSYCAETKLRQEVQMFEPKHSELAYPDILEAFYASSNSGTGDADGDFGSAEDENHGEEGYRGSGNVYETWYPPLRSTLSLLSKLYGVVEMTVFEDIARRSIDQCVYSLRSGSETMKRTRPALHGDLFLVRHLLILREQMVPFEMKLQGTEKFLDFSTTGTAFGNFVSNSRTFLRFDQENALLRFATAGVPRLGETALDARKNLDFSLKTACQSLKVSALKLLMGPIVAFLSKVTAFVGDIPCSEGSAGTHHNNNIGHSISNISGSMPLHHLNAHSDADAGADGSIVEASADDMGKGRGGGGGALISNRSEVLLSPQARSSLKSQSFVRPERLKEMLESAQSVAVQAGPELKATMQLYIENSVARSILLRPILAEFDASKRKLQCVVASCLDPGQGRRDIEQLVEAVSYSIHSELN